MIKLVKRKMENTMDVATKEGESKDYGYGYYGRQLYYNGNRMNFMAICHVDEELPIDIVSTNHRFIPHEELESQLKKNEFQIDNILYSWNKRRAYFFLPASDEAGVIVTNSIDRSMAINVYAYVGKSVLVGKNNGKMSQVAVQSGKSVNFSKFSRIYRMHTKGFDMKEFIEGVNNVMDSTKEFEYMWNGLYEIPVQKAIDFFDDVKNKIPKKYCLKFIEQITQKTEMSLGELYEKMCNALWSNSKMDEKTKIMYYGEVNDATFACWLVEKG